MVNSSIRGGLAATFAVAAALLIFIAAGTTYWTEYESSSVKFHGGLFETCSEFGSSKTCTDTKDLVSGDDEDKLETCQSFIIIGGIIAGVAMLGTFFVVFKDAAKSKFVALLWIAAMACVVVVLSIYDDTFKRDNTDYGYSFILACISVFVCLVMALVTGSSMLTSF
uniref:Uncharacterized protein n=1 Tax=Coccolithus braarudii TaxID=221442 RepID=A0A7S0L5Y4_9EUKA|mmetsp:Transcript_21616/g.46590  ORF Transcript_21616/g.46590 Transcript_21616/m.46590 type:complete len:167 (+) Transcript_21616:199-699(+)